MLHRTVACTEHATNEMRSRLKLPGFEMRRRLISLYPCEPELRMLTDFSEPYACTNCGGEVLPLKAFLLILDSWLRVWKALHSRPEQ